MTDKERIDKAIKLRQAVIDGGELYFNGDGEKSLRNIVGDIMDFEYILFRAKDYSVKPRPVKIPLTYDDFMQRFKSNKPRDFYSDHKCYTVVDFYGNFICYIIRVVKNG